MPNWKGLWLLLLVLIASVGSEMAMGQPGRDRLGIIVEGVGGNGWQRGFGTSPLGALN